MPTPSELPALARSVASNLDRIHDSLTALIAGRMPVVVAAETARAATDDAVEVLEVIAVQAERLSFLLPRGHEVPMWPSDASRDGLVLPPERAAQWLRDVPGVAGRLARDWAEGWRRWANDCEALLEELCVGKAS